jgi:DNA-binding HxlR family transcriptional regulator
MTEKPVPPCRSDCPLNVCLEIFGDRWSLLIVRDLMFKRQHEFKDFLAAGEGIATNVLSDRLRRLEQHGIITKAAHPSDARKVDYRLSEKGLDLAPVLMEMVIWAAKHEKTAAPASMVRRMVNDRQSFLADIRAYHHAERS